MTADPREAYASRLRARREELAALERQDRGLSVARGVVGAIALLALIALGWVRALAVGLGLAALAFVVLAVVHERVARRLARARRRVAFHEAALDRVRGDWIGRGEPGARFLDLHHPYAADLDLFGRGSLFERLCVARTHAGQDLLASWLLQGSPVGVLRERQRAAAELGPRLELREDMAVLGAEARHAVDSKTLADWAAAPPVAVPEHLRRLAFACSAAVLASLLGLDWWGLVPFYLATAGVAFCGWRARSFSRSVLDAIGRPVHDLQALAEMFDRLAGERFQAPRLAQLHAALTAEREAPARPIARLRSWLEMHESKGNVLFAILAFYLVWDLQLAAAVEGWRRRFGAAVGRWLAALGELEALASLGAYAFECPADPYPELVESGPRLEASGLAHPLIPEPRAVRNDVSFDAERQMLVVTGSNMSGKSTLLRTVGTNTVLALAGAPVRAVSLRLSPLAVGASIRVQDSLQDGESRFYAEIKRIRQVLDIARGAVPALFLLDEIFDGTNSAERRIGAEAVVRSLLDLRAIGLVTSHDLALAEIAVSLAPRATNVHFEDHLEGSVIAFDYRLKPGPVQKGNALGLMRAVGLEV
jgi:ABC-type multidrug transport system fused ATPase/permease subunit